MSGREPRRFPFTYRQVLSTNNLHGCECKMLRASQKQVLQGSQTGPSTSGATAKQDQMEWGRQYRSHWSPFMKSASWVKFATGWNSIWQKYCAVLFTTTKCGFLKWPKKPATNWQITWACLWTPESQKGKQEEHNTCDHVVRHRKRLNPPKWGPRATLRGENKAYFTDKPVMSLILYWLRYKWLRFQHGVIAKSVEHGQSVSLRSLYTTASLCNRNVCKRQLFIIPLKSIKYCRSLSL